MPALWRNCGILLLAVAGLLPAQRGGRGGGMYAGPGMRGRGLNAVDRWNDMSPEQRQKALDKLPPERRRQIEERIQRFNQLPPAEQQRLRERYDRFRQLPPEKQRLVRQQIQRFQQLPAGRRQELRREFAQLRNMPESDRRARINSEEFRNRFSPEEQQILHDLSETLPAPKAK